MTQHSNQSNVRRRKRFHNLSLIPIVYSDSKYHRGKLIYENNIYE